MVVFHGGLPWYKLKKSTAKQTQAKWRYSTIQAMIMDSIPKSEEIPPKLGT